MSIFSFSKQKKVEVKNLVWMNQSAKLEGARKILGDYDKVIMIAWFSDTLDVFDQFLNAKNGLNVEIVMSRSLHSSQITDKVVVFLEHNPLLTKEEELLKNSEPVKIIYLNSLDEPIFNLFGGERVVDMMKSLGMKEDEVIEHPMITKSIEQVQKKIEAKVSFENTAGSQKEWLERNLPQGV